jgi:hypothetical protein
MPYDENGFWYEEADEFPIEFDPDAAAEVLNTAAYGAAYLAAQEVAQQGAAQQQAILDSQLNIAASEVNRQLSDKYSDWEEMREHTIAAIEKNHDLIPDVEAALDPHRLAQGLENAYRLGREDAADAAAANRWNEIMRADTGRLKF